MGDPVNRPCHHCKFSKFVRWIGYQSLGRNGLRCINEQVYETAINI